MAEEDIAFGDELTFACWSTEWTMVQPFECVNGSGSVSGARDVPWEKLRSYFLNEHIVQLKLAQLKAKKRGHPGDALNAGRTA